MHGPEPVVLGVSAIRQKIFEKTRHDGNGAGPGAAAGRLFHLCAASVVDRESSAHWQRTLGGEDRNAGTLADSVYDSVLGPELSACRSALAGEQLLLVWKAVKSYAQWFTSLIDQARDGGAIRFDSKRERWEGATDLFQGERKLTRQFHEEGWRAPVVITGVPDEVIRAGDSRWCVVEFKLGEGHPEADALQACLYHEMLAGNEPNGSATAAALVRFGENGREELVLNGEQIHQSRDALMNLVGEVAGVVGDASPRDPEPDPTDVPPVWPKRAGEAEKAVARRMLDALKEFKADGRLSGEPIVGPAFVRYFVEPEHGVSEARIRSQGGNIQVRLGLSSEPVIHLV